MAAKPKKSLKANVASLSTNFLRLINFILIAGGIGATVVIFIINATPTLTGWGFIGLGVAVVLSGVFGTIASGQIGCFGCHMMLLFLSSAGLAAGFLCIFLLFDNVLYDLEPRIELYDARECLKANGAVYFVLFASQLIVLLLACMIQVCGFLEHSEDLEAIMTAKEVARMQSETDARRSKHGHDGGSGGGGSGSSAGRLVDKMKAKYAQWTRKGSGSSPAGLAAQQEYDMETQKLDAGPKSNLYAG